MTDELERLAREAQSRKTDFFTPSFRPDPDVILALLEERRVLRERLVNRRDAALHTPGDGYLYAGLVEAVRILDVLQAEPARAEEGAS